MGAGQATTGADHAAPGKATRVAELERSALHVGPADVSGAARAEVGSAFGARGQGVDYSVGGGSAEGRGVNAVTIGGKVDFAPGQFDPGGPDGRARLGEETAHAVQQSNQGAPASVGALEGEAKRAGLDFAAGHTPKVELAAPAGSALADDPKDAKDTAPKDTDPSPEVPDLQQGEVAAIQKVLASDRDEALRLLLKALQRINAADFSATDLTDNKLHSGGPTRTKQGAAFEAWLATYLDDVATKASKTTNKLTKTEVKKAIQDAKPPADKKDIKVTMGNGHFASVALLYSSVRHEFIHVQQLRKDYLTQISPSVMPAGLDPPASGSLGKDRELEAYLWEMEHLSNTGLKDPGELKLLWNECSNAFLNASATATATFGTRFKAAFKNVWKKAMDGHIAAIADHHKKFKASGAVSEPGKVESLKDDMEMMWLNKSQFENTWAAHTAAHTAALDQAKEMIAAIKAERFTRLIDAIDKEVTTGYTDSDEAFSRWEKLSSAWGELETATKAAMKTRYETTAPLLWEKTFDALETEIKRRISIGEAEIAQELMTNSVGDLFRKADKAVKTGAFDARRKALQSEITKAKAKVKKP